MMLPDDTSLAATLETLGVPADGAADAIKRANRFEYRSIHWEVRNGPGGAWALMRSAQTGSILVQQFFPREA